MHAAEQDFISKSLRRSAPTPSLFATQIHAVHIYEGACVIIPIACATTRNSTDWTRKCNEDDQMFRTRTRYRTRARAAGTTAAGTTAALGIALFATLCTATSDCALDPERTFRPGSPGYEQRAPIYNKAISNNPGIIYAFAGCLFRFILL